MNSIISILIATLALTVAGSALAADNKPASSTSATAPALRKDFTPPRPATEKIEKVTLDGVILVSPESEFQGNIEVADLTKLIDRTEYLAQGIFAASTQPGILMLQFDCSPTSQKVKVAFKGKPEQALMEQIYEYASQMERLKVKSKPVSFKVQFSIAP